ncbi:MAG TPA: hypothetical protein VMV69_12250 [Pirellulales bacterium]|nr:hypothetical protein [Pirellulales bacterium]
MTNLVKRLALFPFRLFWRMTDTVRDRAIRRLDERLELALTAHAGRLSEQIADGAAEHQHELASGLRSVEICLDSVLRELARLQGLVDEISMDEVAAVHTRGGSAGTSAVGGDGGDVGGEASILSFPRREAA